MYGPEGASRHFAGSVIAVVLGSTDVFVGRYPQAACDEIWIHDPLVRGVAVSASWRVWTAWRGENLRVSLSTCQKQMSPCFCWRAP